MAASAFGSQCKVKSLFMSWVDVCKSRYELLALSSEAPQLRNVFQWWPLLLILQLLRIRGHSLRWYVM
jgi:hypothetical protein